MSLYAILIFLFLNIFKYFIGIRNLRSDIPLLKNMQICILPCPSYNIVIECSYNIVNKRQGHVIFYQ